LRRDFIIRIQCIGSVTAVLIAFLKRLLTRAGRVIFLILDRGPGHIARKTKAFVESLKGSLRLFWLPRNPPIATLRSLLR
jgi:hypothetical protein